MPASSVSSMVSSLAVSAATCDAISSASSPAYSTILMPSISLSGTSVIRSLTVCQTISCFARLRTFESTVSTDIAFACTISGALRKAESNVLYLTLTKVRTLGMRVRFNFASVIKASDPSAPHKTRVISKLLSVSLSAFFRS